MINLMVFKPSPVVKLYRIYSQYNPLTVLISTLYSLGHLYYNLIWKGSLCLSVCFYVPPYAMKNFRAKF